MSSVVLLLLASGVVGWVAWIAWLQIRGTLSDAHSAKLSAWEWLCVAVIAGLIVFGAAIGAGPADMPIGKLLRGDE